LEDEGSGNRAGLRHSVKLCSDAEVAICIYLAPSQPAAVSLEEDPFFLEARERFDRMWDRVRRESQDFWRRLGTAVGILIHQGGGRPCEDAP
jgi:hypothetical protein